MFARITALAGHAGTARVSTRGALARLGRIAFISVGCVLAFHAPVFAQTQASRDESPVIFKFVTVGDSRQEPGAPGNNAQDERWLQSTAVFARMLREMEAQKPQALIFNGDMIHGYTTDMTAIDREYAFWRGMVAGLMERGTYVLPVPGNHEMQLPIIQPDGTKLKRAQLAQENAWRENMGDLILNETLWKRTTGLASAAWHVDHRPVIGQDGITTDQRQLSYSFDAGIMHIAVINTDPVGFDESAPAVWLAADFEAARQRGAKVFFVFGHKPAFTYFPALVDGASKKKDKAAEDGFATRAAIREKFWDVVEQFGATYFCGHQHLYHASQPRKDAGGRAWQVIIGSGGSPLGVKPGTSKDPLDSMYAWAEVSVHADARVDIAVRGFDAGLGHTVPLERWSIPAHTDDVNPNLKSSVKP
jgi:hypothetical protein